MTEFSDDSQSSTVTYNRFWWKRQVYKWIQLSYSQCSSSELSVQSWICRKEWLAFNWLIKPACQFTLSHIWSSVMHSPSTHLNSNSGHGDECAVDGDSEAFTISTFCFTVVVSSGGFCDVVGIFLMVLRNRRGIFVVVEELVVALGFTKIGTTSSPVEIIRSPSESLWSCSKLDCP